MAALKERSRWIWRMRFKMLLLFLSRLGVISVVVAIVYGFWLSGQNELVVKRRAEYAAVDEAREEALRSFSPDVIDPAAVLEYAESQRLKLEILGEALLAYKSAHGKIPDRRSWQTNLINSKTLKAPVVLDTFPIDITWRRKQPPPPEVFPAEDTDGYPVIQLAAAGIVIATCKAGEIIVTDQPVPEDAAMPLEDSPGLSVEKFGEAPRLLPERPPRRAR